MKRALKKKLALFGCGVVGILLVIGILVYAQWHETQSLYFQVQETPSTSQEPILSENATSTTVDSSALISSTPEPAGEDDEDLVPNLAEQETTDSDILALTPNEGVVESGDSDSTALSPNTTDNTDTVNESTEAAQQLVDQAIDGLLGYEDDFTASLDGLYQSASADYYALPEEERTSENKESIALGYALEAAILESNCDNLVSTLLNQLTIDLETLGEDSDVVSELMAGYLEKKTAKKDAYYAMLN